MKYIKLFETLNPDYDPTIEDIKITSSNDIKITKDMITYSGVNFQDAFGYTSLMHACHDNNFQKIILLMNSGADLSIKNKEGNDFSTFSTTTTINKIKELFPEQYEYYILKKIAKKYNL